MDSTLHVLDYLVYEQNEINAQNFCEELFSPVQIK